MPEPGYGQFPHTKSVPMSQAQVDAASALAAERGISFAAAVRLLVDRGLSSS